MSKYLYEDLFLVVSESSVFSTGEEIQISEIEELLVVDSFKLRANSMILPALFTKNIFVGFVIAGLACSFVFLLLGIKSRYSLKVRSGNFEKKIYESNSLEKLNQIKVIIEGNVNPTIVTMPNL